MRIALVGLGSRGRFWAETIRRSTDCELIGYVDPDPAALDRAQERFGKRPSFASLAEALAELDGVHALVLATPPETRDPDIAAACAYRLPLLVEKPLALDLEQASCYVEQTEAAGVPLMVGLNFRYLPVTQAYLELLDTGAAGQVEFARLTYERWRDGTLARLNSYPLKMAQPMLWEQSIHHFDLMRFVYRREPVAVYCRSWNPSWTMYADDTNIAALFEFEDNFEVNYQGTWQGGWDDLGFEWRTDGSEGIITQRDMFGALFHAKRADTELTEVDLPPFERWITDTSGLLAAFVRALRGAPLECSGRDHLRSLAMVEACILSAREGGRVEIPPLLERPGTGRNHQTEAERGKP